MARYGQAFKDRAVARLLPPESAALEDVSREVGVGVATLERWRSDALARPARERVWTAAARLDAVLTTAAMDEAGKSAWCRANGVYPAASWTTGAQVPRRRWPSRRRRVPARSRPGRTARRIKELERELRRKDRRWPRRLRCWYFQKKSRRSSTRARTNDRPRRSPQRWPGTSTSRTRPAHGCAWPARSWASTCARCSAGRPAKAW